MKIHTERFFHLRRRRITLKIFDKTMHASEAASGHAPQLLSTIEMTRKAIPAIARKTTDIASRVLAVSFISHIPQYLAAAAAYPFELYGSQSGEYDDRKSQECNRAELCVKQIVAHAEDGR